MSAITVTTDPPIAPITPTVTHYQQLSDDFIKAIDQITTLIPQLREAEAAVARVTRGQLGVPEKFCRAAIAAVEQIPDLRALNRMDPVASLDTLQFLEAFGKVRERAMAFAKNLKFTFDTRKASLNAAALQIYALAKDLARDGRSPEIAAHVETMSQHYASRKQATKAGIAARKELKFQQAVEAAVAARMKEVKALAA